MKLGKRCNMITDVNGTKTCMRDGKIHRKGGPAIEYISGDHYWYNDGLLHREDGPAYEGMHTGYKQWYLHGVQYTEENHRRKLAGEELLPTIMNWGGSSGVGGEYYNYTISSGSLSNGYVSTAGTLSAGYANTYVSNVSSGQWLTGSVIYYGINQTTGYVTKK